MKALRKPRAGGFAEALSIPGFLLGTLCLAGFLGALLWGFFGSLGMRSRAGVGVIGLLLLLEAILSYWTAYDVWRHSKSS